jgi:hypothetical protein
MTFKQREAASGGADNTNTIELWEHGECVATIHALSGGVQLICERGWAPQAHGLAVQVQPPFGIIVGLQRE